MLHLSLFLFFAGLAVFLWNVNLTIFKLVLSWVGLCTALYGCITFLPVFCHNSPYLTPLSLPAWHFVTGISFLAFRALKWITLSIDYFSQGTYDRFRLLAERYGRLLVRGMQKMAEESAFNSPPEIVTCAFMWTLDCLDEDHELERFFAGLPGFRASKMVKDPLPDLTLEQQEKLLDTLIGLSGRTSSSDLLPKQVKIRRIVVCAKAIGSVDIPEAIEQVLNGIISSEDQYGLVQSTEFARVVGGWDDDEGEWTTTTIRAMVLSVLVRAQRRDDLWFSMAADAMGLPESDLRYYAMHGDSLSLAILIHVVRQQFSLYWKLGWPKHTFSKVLEAASKFDALNTSPELQHEFCALWNQVIRADDLEFPGYILRPIRNVYLTLHLHTDSVPTAFSPSTSDEDVTLYARSSYPLCNITGHHPDSTAHIHDVSSSPSIPHTVLNDNDALVPAFSLDASSPCVPAPVFIDENTMDMPLLDMSVLASPHPTQRPVVESLGGPATSPNPLAIASAARDMDTSARTIPPITSETPTSTSSVRPLATSEHSLQNISDLFVLSDAPEILSPASPEPVFDDITESPCSILSTTRPGASPWPTSAPERNTAEGSPKTGSREDKDALDPSSVNHAIQTNTIALPDCPPLTPPLATNITVASPLQQGVDAEHAGDPPHASHGQYDIV